MTHWRRNHHDPARDWTCDCGHVNGWHRHECAGCGLLVTDREVEAR